MSDASVVDSALQMSSCLCMQCPSAEMMAGALVTEGNAVP